MGSSREGGGGGETVVGARVGVTRAVGARAAVARVEVARAEVARVATAIAHARGGEQAAVGRAAVLRKVEVVRMQPARACWITEKPSRSWFRGSSSTITTNAVAASLLLACRELKKPVLVWG